MYREATNAELNSARYISSKQHITDRHIDGGEFVGCDVLELAMTGEQVSADGKSTARLCSPMLVQLAWLTIHADTVDLELDFLSEYAATCGPLMLGRVISRLCSPERDDVPEGCQEFRAKELWATRSSAD